MYIHWISIQDLGTTLGIADRKGFNTGGLVLMKWGRVGGVRVRTGTLVQDTQSQLQLDEEEGPCSPH